VHVHVCVYVVTKSCVHKWFCYEYVKHVLTRTPAGTHTHTHAHAYTYTRKHAHAHAHTHTMYIYSYIYIYIYICIHIHTYICISIYTYMTLSGAVILCSGCLECDRETENHQNTCTYLHSTRTHTHTHTHTRTYIKPIRYGVPNAVIHSTIYTHSHKQISHIGYDTHALTHTHTNDKVWCIRWAAKVSAGCQDA